MKTLPTSAWNMRVLTAIFVVIAIILPGLNSCAVNPATGGVDFVTMSEEGEVKLGKEKHEELIEGNPLYDNEKLADYINAVGQRVAKTSDRPDLEFHFTLLDQPEVNAFALPGGYVYITRGIVTYLKSEEELAAVLAHEVAHITARHHVRSESSRLGKNVGDVFASILSVLTTGTNVLGDVSNLYSTAAYLGYGREHELEADQFGARYLHSAGYDPQAMVKVIGVLKDQERFSRAKEKDRGGKTRAYHGVFSTHPRNDQRLREVVNAAGELTEGERIADIGNFREITEGVVFGVNYELSFGKKDDPRRFTHRNLGFTLLMPEGWVADNQQNEIIFAPPEKQSKLTMEVKRLTANVAPDEFIRRELNIPLLKKSEPFTQHGLIGHMGLKDGEGESFPERIAVIYQANRVYVFTGTIATQEDGVNYDEMFVNTVRSFRPVRVANPQNLKSRKIHYVKANERTTFAALAKLSPIGRYAEEELRLINGYYPSGEPRNGEWIKIVQ
jgi:predicted Zn-dependent protease